MDGSALAGTLQEGIRANDLFPGVAFKPQDPKSRLWQSAAEAELPNLPMQCLMHTGVWSPGRELLIEPDAHCLPQAAILGKKAVDCLYDLVVPKRVANGQDLERAVRP
jgi:hypothetical protein